MAYRYFPGKSQEWLEDQLDSCLEDLASGKTLTSWGNAGDSASKQIVSNPMERRRMLLWDLYQLAPDIYPIDSIRTIRTTTGKLSES